MAYLFTDNKFQAKLSLKIFVNFTRPDGNFSTLCHRCFWTCLIAPVRGWSHWGQEVVRAVFLLFLDPICPRGREMSAHRHLLRQWRRDDPAGSRQGHPSTQRLHPCGSRALRLAHPYDDQFLTLFKPRIVTICGSERGAQDQIKTEQILFLLDVKNNYTIQMTATDGVPSLCAVKLEVGFEVLGTS